MKTKFALLLFFLTMLVSPLAAQQVPSAQENLDYIVTFGKNAGAEWGDDDHVQTYFFLVPTAVTSPVFIRIYDPEVSGKNDQLNQQFNTKTKFTVYGGNGCYSNKDARGINPVGNFKSGVQLFTRTFGNDTAYNEKWFTMGPFNPSEGEFDSELKGRIFKVVVEGLDGDDGNMYRFFFSTSRTEGKPIEGSNAFTYELCFRLVSKPNSVAHLYPFVDSKVTSVNQSNFDFDGLGQMSLTSVLKKLRPVDASGNGVWSHTTYKIDTEEKNTSIDIRIVANSPAPNDMVMYITNQYDEAVPFFSSPIGGIPKYKYKIDINYDVK
jgi:hypothetical protein